MQTPAKPGAREAVGTSPVFKGARQRKDDSDPLWEMDKREDSYLFFSCDRIEESLRMLERLNAKAPAGELPLVTVRVECQRSNGTRVTLGESGGTKIGKSRGNNVPLPPANISMATVGADDFIIITAQAGGIIIGARRWTREGFLSEWLEVRKGLSIAPGETTPWKIALHTNTELLDKFSSAKGPMQMISPIKSPGAPDSAAGGAGDEADAAVADPPADPATAAFITAKVDVRFKNAGVLALSFVSVDNIKSGSSNAKVRVTMTKDGKPATQESALSKTPLPNASWGKEGAGLDTALRLWLEPDCYGQNLSIGIVQENGGAAALLAACSLHPSQVTMAAHIDIPLKLNLMAPNDAAGAGGAVIGTLNAIARFFPAGVLQVNVLEANDVTGRNVLDQSCFATLEVASKLVPASSASLQTDVDDRCGSRPIWKETRLSMYAAHHLGAVVTVHTLDLVGGNENLGSVRIDLASVYREGRKATTAWVPITRVNRKTGQSVESGTVHVKAKFFAPSEVRGLGFGGVSFPQDLTSPAVAGEEDEAPSSVATVDLIDSARAGTSASSSSSSDTALALMKPGSAGSARSGESGSSAIVKSTAIAGGAEVDLDDEDAGDFDEAEIEQAFDFLDLDKNNMIGFMEIKHLLACMGELVTDEEVDMMVRMCDPDGKGMLNFFDVYAVAKHPNPSAPKFNAKRIGNKLKQKMRAGETTFNTQRLESTSMAAGAGGGGGEDEYAIPETYRDAKKKAKSAEEIQAENKARIEQKRRRQTACAHFVNRYNLRLPQLKQILGRAEKTNAYKRQEGHLNFVELCRLFEIDPSAAPEAQELFDAYVHTAADGSKKEHRGKANLREVLLACCAFSYSTFQQRARFVFDMFDDDGSGSLSIPEMIEIMKANHFSSDEEAAKRRLAVILRESKRTGEAIDKVDLSISDFMQLAKLFPNVVFPPLPASFQASMSSSMQEPVDFPALIAGSRRDSLGEDGVGEGAALKLAAALAAAEADDDEELINAIKAGAAAKLAAANSAPSASLSLAMAGAGTAPTGRAGKLAPLTNNRSPTGGPAPPAATTDSNNSRPESKEGSRPPSSGSRLFGSLGKSVKGLFGSPSGKIAPSTPQ